MHRGYAKNKYFQVWSVFLFGISTCRNNVFTAILYRLSAFCWSCDGVSRLCTCVCIRMWIKVQSLKIKNTCQHPRAVTFTVRCINVTCYVTANDRRYCILFHSGCFWCHERRHDSWWFVFSDLVLTHEFFVPIKLSTTCFLSACWDVVLEQWEDTNLDKSRTWARKIHMTLLYGSRSEKHVKHTACTKVSNPK